MLKRKSSGYFEFRDAHGGDISFFLILPPNDIHRLGALNGKDHRLWNERRLGADSER